MPRLRLDVYTAQTAGVSRSYAASLITGGLVSVNGKREKAGYLVRDEDKVIIEPPELRELSVKPENIPVEILYEDEGMAVVNKPRGMVTHAGASHFEGTLVNALLFHFDGKLSGINGVLRPGIVHRLDKDTSGAVVIAKNDVYHAELARQLQERQMERIYLAVVHGDIKDDEGVVKTYIGRHKKDRTKMAVCNEREGRAAVTYYRVLERVVHNNKRYTLVKCSLETGRTHQIRVHFQTIGFSLLGDDLYYNNADLTNNLSDRYNIKRHALHAVSLEFQHPVNKSGVKIECGLPEDIQKIIKKI
jgi:23S rRNA pseudouridine1911/1915/1917 synthase